LDILNSQLWNSLARSSYELEHSMDPLHRKRTGSYYTSLELTYIMMQDLVQSFSPEERDRLYGMTFLEPCVGTGNFVFAYLVVCKSLGFSTEQYRQLINNIYVCDINSRALELYKNNLTTLVHNLFDIDLDDTYFADHVFPGLLFDLDSNHVEYIPIENRIPGFSSSKGFDIVVTNPPYKNLKAERSHYKNDGQHGTDKELYTAIGRLAEMYLKYSTTGTLNIYKMFVEEIIDKYTSASGRCSLLIPASILTDKSCGKLRKFIFGRSKLESVRLISEDSDYVDASQALCAVQLHKGMPNTNVAVSGSLNGNIQMPTLIPFKDMVDETADSSVLVLTQNEYHIRKLMQKHPTIKSLPYISNLRGELDLTLHKRHITKSETPYKLLRGRNISHYQLIETEDADFAEPEFVESTTKRKFISKTRLVCQQIANMAKKRRVSFALVPSNVVLGNSCNFLSVDPNADGVDEFFLLGVLNSPLIDWFFKLSSSNNHINNYEIDTFPIPVKSKFCRMISDAVQTYLANPEEILLLKINALVTADDMRLAKRYIKAAAVRSTLSYNALMEHSLTARFFSEQQNHDVLSLLGMNAVGPFDQLLDDLSVTILVNRSNRSFVVPQNCYYCVSRKNVAVFVVPISPQCAYVLMPREHIDNEDGNYAVVSESPQIDRMNFHALKYEYMFSGSFVAASCRSELEKLQHLRQKHLVELAALKQ